MPHRDPTSAWATQRGNQRALIPSASARRRQRSDPERAAGCRTTRRRRAWKAAKGPVMSEGSMSMQRGTNRPSSRLLARAPDSYSNHGADWFDLVRQTMPKLVAARAAASSTDHRAPLLISSVDIHGLMAGTIMGSFCRSARAIERLGSPLHEMKTRIDYRSLVMSEQGTGWDQTLSVSLSPEQGILHFMIASLV